MKIRKIKLLTIIAATAFTGAMAQGPQAQNTKGANDAQAGCTHHRHQGMHARHRGFGHLNIARMRMFKKRNLTYDQRSKIKELRKAERKIMRANRKQFRGSKNMRSFISVDGFDKAGFVQMRTSRSKDMLKGKADMVEKIMNILTPEQRLMLADKFKENHKDNEHQAK